MIYERVQRFYSNLKRQFRKFLTPFFIRELNNFYKEAQDFKRYFFVILKFKNLPYWKHKNRVLIGWFNFLL